MFNLEQSIAEWRKQMLAAGIKSPVPLEELESHLREEIGRQKKLGIDAQQAFQMTVSQIGQGAELKTEFSKAGGLFGFLGNDKFTRTNRLLGALWLVLCSWAFSAVCRAIAYHPPLHGSAQKTGFYIAMSLLFAAYGTGVFGSVLLLRSAKLGRNIIKVTAVLFLLTGILLAFIRLFSLKAFCFDSFYLATAWLLFSQSNAKPNTSQTDGEQYV